MIAGICDCPVRRDALGSEGIDRRWTCWAGLDVRIVMVIVGRRV